MGSNGSNTYGKLLLTIYVVLALVRIVLYDFALPWYYLSVKYDHVN